jgi:hypothetical protein
MSYPTGTERWWIIEEARRALCLAVLKGMVERLTADRAIAIDTSEVDKAAKELTDALRAPSVCPSCNQEVHHP